MIETSAKVIAKVIKLSCKTAILGKIAIGAVS